MPVEGKGRGWSMTDGCPQALGMPPSPLEIRFNGLYLSNSLTQTLRAEPHSFQSLNAELTDLSALEICMTLLRKR